MAKKNSNVNLEIERKFLLRDVPFFKKRMDNYILDIYQFYFEEKGKRIRYRKSTDESLKSTYYSTRKKLISKGTYEEIEFEISEKTYHKKFKETTGKRKGISKQRFVYKYKAHKFEIDVFTFMKLVVMEVELTDINQKITFPDFIKKEILMEVTGIKEFTNYSLSI